MHQRVKVYPGLGQSSKFIKCSTSLASQPFRQQCMQRTQHRAHCSLYNTCWMIKYVQWSIPPFHSTECRRPRRQTRQQSFHDSCLQYYSRSTGVNLTSSFPCPSARRSCEFSLVQDQLLATHTCLNSCLPLARATKVQSDACATYSHEVCSVLLTSFKVAGKWFWN